MSKPGRRGKSKNWAERQNRDPYVRKARQTGMRARSAFKLEEIDRKYRLIRPGSRVVDLGAAPGSWSQYVLERIGPKGVAVGVDLLEMKDLPGLNFVRGDFTDETVQQQALNHLDGEQFDLVLSDMAPNITGIRVTDQARAEELQLSILAFCRGALVRRGSVLTKLFEGENAKSLTREYRRQFGSIQIIKPDASRQQSREVYLLARDFRPDT